MDDDKVELRVVDLKHSTSQTGPFAISLREVDGRRILPIIIGVYEAQAIAVALENVVTNRPMTHDLFKSFAQHFDFEVRSVLIYKLHEGVFHARILCGNQSQSVEIDSRTSDAIAIALRFEAPIYCLESIMSEAAIITGKPDLYASEPAKGPAKKKTWAEQLKDTPADELRTLLDKTLSEEDYEKAAQIRDELNRRN